MVEDIEELPVEPQFHPLAYWELFREVEVAPEEIRATQGIATMYSDTDPVTWLNLSAVDGRTSFVDKPRVAKGTGSSRGKGVKPSRRNNAKR